MVRGMVAAAGAVLALLTSATASAKCQLARYVEIPVVLEGRRAVVTAQIDGRPARFMLDSGAFFSTIAKASALEYGLPITILPGASIRGIGGSSSLGYTTVKAFGFVGQSLKNIQFAVGGSDTGFAGILGQNILGIGDVEYDLPHGTVRLLKAIDCKKAVLAYWAGDRPVTVVTLEPRNNGNVHTIGTITVNGVKIKALFDTGATRSLLTLAAAKRMGLKPGGPDMEPDGFATGIGQGQVRSWRARFTTIDIGGELIKRPYISVADQTLDGPDMLIGIDFFQTHHIYVDHQTNRMYITYEGGPLFGLDPKGAVDAKGTALDLTDKAGDPTDAAGYSRRGAILATRRNFTGAIADFDKAIAMAPGDAQYLVQRAMAHLANDHIRLGAADIDKAIALAPSDADARLVRAHLRLTDEDHSGALADLKVADAHLAASSDARRELAGLYETLDVLDHAQANYDQWLKAHPEDSGRAEALNGRCWIRALRNAELDKALDDCNAAVRLRPRNGSFLDSRALVRLRRGELDKALSDYNAALAAEPESNWSLYARSLVERRLGDVAKADADRAKALTLNPKVAERARHYHVE